ncbi:MAG: hypothetical protein J7L21_01915 [Sulfurimonas sp.]|nr:hypothetical protein [Sulfurimonas sp.]
MNIFDEKLKLDKRQRKVYEIEKQSLFVTSGDVEFSIMEALSRAREIQAEHGDVFMLVTEID